MARFLDSRRPSGWGPWERFPVASRAGPGSPIRRSAIWPQRNGARGRDGPSVNPLAQVPTLVLPGGQVMTESAAITLHLADATPVGSCAYPSEFQPGTSLRRGTGRYHAINDLDPAWFAEPSVYDNIEGCDRLTPNPKTPSQIGEKFYGPSALDRLSGEGLLKRATQRLCVNRGALDDVASMAVAALEHPEASVTATGEVGF